MTTLNPFKKAAPAPLVTQLAEKQAELLDEKDSRSRDAADLAALAAQAHQDALRANVQADAVKRAHAILEDAQVYI